MRLSPLEARFTDVAVLRGSVFLLPATEALRFIDECEKARIAVLGVEAFKVFGEKIQPFQEHSFDLHGEGTNSHSIARDFIRKRLDLDLYFEVGIAEDNSDSG